MYARLTIIAAPPLTLCLTAMHPRTTPASDALFSFGLFAITVRLHITTLLLSLSTSSAAHISWLDGEFKKALAAASSISDLSISVTIHVTSSSESGIPTLDDDDSGVRDLEKDGSYDAQASPSSEKMPAEALQTLSGADIKYGRPDIPKMLEEAVRSSDGPVSVDG